MQTDPLSTMTAPASSSGPTNSNGLLGKDDFLKILVGEMSHMDPMSADSKDPTQAVAQMAQFSMVEQLTNLAQSSDRTSAMGMLGKTVTYKDPNGGTKQGVVQSVDTSNSTPTLTIGAATGIAPAAVIQVS
jgi:flagellar basal-body rod modification protein FlgD